MIQESQKLEYPACGERPELMVSRRELTPPSSTCSWARRGEACPSSHTTTGVSSQQDSYAGAHTRGGGNLARKVSIRQHQSHQTSYQTSIRTTPRALGQAWMQAVGQGKDCRWKAGYLWSIGLEGVFLASRVCHRVLSCCSVRLTVA